LIDFVNVGKTISNHRKKHQLTQDQLADQLFVTRQLVSKWELGLGIPSIDTLLALSKLFSVSFEELLCLDEKINIHESNLFAGHDRSFIINNIISGKIKVNIPQVIHQFTSTERMMILRAIHKKKLIVSITALLPRLTTREIKLLKTEDVTYDIKKSSK
jgi:transcriptional regulator with XRE-family HTH domain